MRKPLRWSQTGDLTWVLFKWTPKSYGIDCSGPHHGTAGRLTHCCLAEPAVERGGHGGIWLP